MERVKELKIKYLEAEMVTGLTEWNVMWGDRLCKNCGNQAEASHDRGRLEYWSRIPLMFGLSKWEDLRNFN